MPLSVYSWWEPPQCFLNPKCKIQLLSFLVMILCWIAPKRKNYSRVESGITSVITKDHCQDRIIVLLVLSHIKGKTGCFTGCKHLANRSCATFCSTFLRTALLQSLSLILQAWILKPQASVCLIGQICNGLKQEVHKTVFWDSEHVLKLAQIINWRVSSMDTVFW